MDFKSELKRFLQKWGIINAAEPEEEMISYEVVYEPDTKDAHGHWMSKSSLEEACENFNKNLKEGVVKSNLFHLQDTEAFTVVDTWIQKEMDVVVAGTDQPIKAGTWVSKIQYNDKDLWELKKAGILGGVSIGARGFVDEETGEITGLSFDGEEEQ